MVDRGRVDLALDTRDAGGGQRLDAGNTTRGWGMRAGTPVSRVDAGGDGASRGADAIAPPMEVKCEG